MAERRGRITLGEACGCDFRWGSDHPDEPMRIVYCPMHKAAPKMLAALELLVEADVTEWSRDAVNKAIAQARGQPQEAK